MADTPHAREAIQRDLDHFSVITLGYDRNSKDPPPRLVIEWGHKQIAREASREASRRKALGGVVTAVLGALACAVLQYFLPLSH